MVTIPVVLLHQITTLNDASVTLRKWADESRKGGWSTHQVEANVRLAEKLERQELALRRALGVWRENEHRR